MHFLQILHSMVRKEEQWRNILMNLQKSYEKRNILKYSFKQIIVFDISTETK